MKLIDRRTIDGSRHFVCLPRSASWQALCEHVALLPGLEIVNFVADGPAEAWLGFTYRGHRFAVRHEGQEFHFFVDDPRCSDLSLYQVAAHCEGLLGNPPTGATPTPE